MAPTAVPGLLLTATAVVITPMVMVKAAAATQ